MDKIINLKNIIIGFNEIKKYSNLQIGFLDNQIHHQLKF